MYNYQTYLRHIMSTGVDKDDRTGTGARSVFGYQMRWNLWHGFPLVTTKKVHLKAIIHELLWFISGSTNIKPLLEHDVHIWDDWADENGNLGPVYGAQWRSWAAHTFVPGINATPHLDGSTTYYGAKINFRRIDQIANVLKSLATDPNSRRHIVSAWNPAEVETMALPPCHALFQFYVRPLSLLHRLSLLPYSERGNLSFGSAQATEVIERLTPAFALDCQLYQRSADSFLGVPFNIASYALLTMMMAQQLGYAPGEFIWTGGDCHIYHNHFDQVNLQLTREPTMLPTMTIAKAPSLFDYKFEDFSLSNYAPHPAIKGPIAV